MSRQGGLAGGVKYLGQHEGGLIRGGGRGGQEGASRTTVRRSRSCMA